MIPLARPDIGEAEIEAVVAALRSGALVQGARVAELESRLADEVGSDVVVVSSCTAALHLALLALGIGPGDRVIVPTYSWVATANVVELCGAEVVFVDIDPSSMNLSLDALVATLDAGSFGAALFVHTFGNAAGVGEAAKVLAEFGVPLVEDAACAFGARTPHGAAGAVGDVGCYSFHPRKALTTGEGGAVTARSPELLDMVRSLRNHGLDPNSSTVDFIRAGYNYRMTEIQAALGVVQASRLDELLGCRRELADRYNELLRATEVSAPTFEDPASHVYQSYVVQLPDAAAGRVGEVIAGMRSREIETTVGTWHLPLSTHFRRTLGLGRGDFPQTDRVFDRALSLPMAHTLSAEDQRTVVDALVETIADLPAR